MADEDLLCWECVSDSVLRDWVQQGGRVGKCSFCGRRRTVRPLPEVAEKIDGAIRRFYRPGEQRGHVVPDSDNLQYWEDGDPATEIIQEIAGVEAEVAEAIDTSLHEAEARDVHDGDDAYYGGVALEHVDAYPDEFMEVWDLFERRLKHEVRFFDERGKGLLDELFADLPTLAGGHAIVTLDPGGEFSTLFRARIADSEHDAEEFIRDPARELGPPPPHRSRAGRMNPAGIPAFYGAFSEDVAVAEVRPPVGALVVVGKCSLLRSVRLLDVSFLPFAFHEESIFSPHYDRLRNKVTFLERFHRRISRPVLPADEALEYLPTQAVAAYVANVMGLDGVIYASIQIGAEGENGDQVARNRCNIALFGRAAKVLGAEPEPEPTEPPRSDVCFPGFGAAQTKAKEEGPDAGSPDTAGAASQHDGEVATTERSPVVGGSTTEENPEPAAAPGAKTDVVAVGDATLRAEAQPTVVRIRSVVVETSPVFAHVYEDGNVIIDEFEDDEYVDSAALPP